MNDRNHTVGTYCGSQSGKIVYVHGSHAVISFRSDGSVQYRGYELFLSFSSRSNSKLAFFLFVVVVVVVVVVVKKRNINLSYLELFSK